LRSLSIDSALLYAGAIGVAREYFADPAITALVNRLLDDVDWQWFRTAVSLSRWAGTMKRFSRYRWNQYSEHVLMSLSPSRFPAARWRPTTGRAGAAVPSGATAIMSTCRSRRFS